jgi:hypothetical protein
VALRWPGERNTRLAEAASGSDPAKHGSTRLTSHLAGSSAILRQMSRSKGAGLTFGDSTGPLRCSHYPTASDFLKASHDSHPTHTNTMPIAARSRSVWADHALATDRLPNTDAR